MPCCKNVLLSTDDHTLSVIFGLRARTRMEVLSRQFLAAALEFTIACWLWEAVRTAVCMYGATVPAPPACHRAKYTTRHVAFLMHWQRQLSLLLRTPPPGDASRRIREKALFLSILNVVTT